MKSTDVVDIYHQNYFLNAVDGYREFLTFDGTEGTLFDRYKRNIDALDLKPSENFLEIGCGRGEIVMYHAKSGGYSMGVDYSSDAIALAIQKRNDLGLDCFFLESSFSKIPLV